MGPLESIWRIRSGKQYVCLRVSTRIVVLLLLAKLGRGERTVYELQFSHFWWNGVLCCGLVLISWKKYIPWASDRSGLVGLRPSLVRLSPIPVCWSTTVLSEN